MVTSEDAGSTPVWRSKAGIGLGVVLLAGIALAASMLLLRAGSPDVRVAYLRIGSDLPFFVGASFNVFEAHGLDVEGVRLGSSDQVREALLSGAVNATDITGSQVILRAALQEPERIRVFMLSAATEDARIHKLLARADSDVESVTDLVGKRLAVFPGSQMRSYVSLALGAILSPEQLSTIELVPLSPPQQRQAMQQGDVDAALTLEPTGTQLLHSGNARLLIDNVLFELVSKPRSFVTAFAALDWEWAQQQPREALALVQAYREVADIIAREPDRARLALADSTGLTSEVAGEAGVYDYVVVPDIDEEVVAYTAELMVTNSLLEELPSVAGLLVDMSTLERLARERGGARER